MNIDAIITILLFAFVFTILYFICLKCKIMDRPNRVIRRNIVAPTIEIDFAPTIEINMDEKENAVRFSQNV